MIFLRSTGMTKTDLSLSPPPPPPPPPPPSPPPTNTLMSANKQKARLQPKYGLLTRAPKAPLQRWGNAEWTFPVPLSVSLYMAPLSRAKRSQHSRNVERFRWQMSNANAFHIPTILKSLWKERERSCQLYFCPPKVPGTHPGYKKQPCQRHYDEMRSSKLHI